MACSTLGNVWQNTQWCSNPQRPGSKGMSACSFCTKALWCCKQCHHSWAVALECRVIILHVAEPQCVVSSKIQHSVQPCCYEVPLVLCVHHVLKHNVWSKNPTHKFYNCSPQASGTVHSPKLPFLGCSSFQQKSWRNTDGMMVIQVSSLFIWSTWCCCSAKVDVVSSDKPFSCSSPSENANISAFTNGLSGVLCRLCR